MQKILAIDDEVENLTMVEYSLQEEYEIIGVKSGKQALKYLEKEKPDLILLDINMPEMNGLQLMEKLKKIPGLDTIPVMFLTSRQEVETEYTCFEMGAVDFIRKPFEPKIVKQRIRRTLRLFQPTADTLEKEENKKAEKDVELKIMINGDAVSIPEKEIEYIEVYNNNCMIVTSQQEWNVRIPLDKLQDMLQGDFIRTGRSYLVNPYAVDKIEDDLVIMKDKKIIKLPRRNKKELQIAIKSRLM